MKQRQITPFEVQCLARCALLGNQGAKRALAEMQVAPIVTIREPETPVKGYATMIMDAVGLGKRDGFGNRK